MRMLAPRELYRAQGFPDSYKIDIEFNGKPLSKTAQVRMCGNSVCPTSPRRSSRPTCALVRMTADAATQHALEYVRAKLVELYRMRVAAWPSNQTPFVNADDVARIIREWPECPPEIHARRSQDWRGAVFRKGWAKTGTYSRSLRPHMRATDLPGWRPLDAAESHSTTRAQRRTA
jgi:hypothetical protein